MKNKLDITIKPLNDHIINITIINLLTSEIGGITRTFSSNSSDYPDLAMFMYNKSLEINCLFDGSVKDICVTNPYMGIRYTKIHPVLRKICKQICRQVSNTKGL